MPSLRSIQPTPEEVEEAKKILAAGKGVQKSKMQCMVVWIKKNLSENEEAHASRGEQRQRYLQAYIVHMMRQKNAKSTVASAHIVSVTNQTRTDVVWWSKYTMDREMGATKAASWREVLQHRADPVCGKDDEDHREYRVPRDWSRMSADDIKAMQVKCEADATNDDLDALVSILVEGDEAPVEVKQEQKTDEEIRKAKIASFLSIVPKKLKRFQDMATEGKVIQPKAQDEKYCATLSDDWLKHINKLNRSIKVLDALVTGRDANREAIPKLMDTLSAMEADHDALIGWSAKFGLCSAKKAKKSKEET